jgi:hypothetical protein
MPKNSPHLISVKVEKLSRTMQDLARLFDCVSVSGYVYTSSAFEKDLKKADVVYDGALYPVTVDTPLPFRPI